MQVNVESVINRPAQTALRVESFDAKLFGVMEPLAKPRNLRARALSAVKRMLPELIRRFLAKRGYALSRIEIGPSRSLNSYLVNLAKRQIDINKVAVFDREPEALNTVIQVFDPEIVNAQSDVKGATQPLDLDKSDRLLVEVDMSALLPHPTAFILSSLERASVVVIRTKMGKLLDGQADLYEIVDAMENVGLRFHDVLQKNGSNLISAACASIFLAFENAIAPMKESGTGEKDRVFRIAETLTQIGFPIAGEREFGSLLGLGSYGFAAGVLNPGAISDGQQTLFLAQAERIPWPIQKKSNSHTDFLSACQPMLLALNEKLEITKHAEVGLARDYSRDLIRFGDFRLFRHQGKLYSNHAVMHCDKEGFDRAPVRPQDLRTSMGIALVDIEKPLLTYLGGPILDRPVARTEKNWAMFSSGDRVNLIYSFNPFRLYSSDTFPDLHFTLAVEKDLNVPLPDEGLALRNSINPISYDSDHLLHMVHKVYPGKRYAFWAVLIDKKTLLPCRLSSRPLVTNRSTGGSAIVYACSAIVRDEEVLVFGGVDDCAIGTWRVPKADIDRHWISIS
jgi:hypothetical protein